MSYLDTNRLANQMGERGKSYTGEALQCKKSQVVCREDYCAYSEIHCDRAGFLLCRLLKKSKKQIPRGLNFTPTSAKTALVGAPGPPARDDKD
jgi:hypothetical protein